MAQLFQIFKQVRVKFNCTFFLRIQWLEKLLGILLCNSAIEIFYFHDLCKILKKLNHGKF